MKELQKEIDRDFKESANLMQSVMASSDPLVQEIANKYFNAITRINQICVNRKRY